MLENNAQNQTKALDNLSKRYQSFGCDESDIA